MSWGTIVAIVVPISVAVLIFIVGICCFCKRIWNKYDSDCKDPHSIQDLLLCFAHICSLSCFSLYFITHMHHLVVQLQVKWAAGIRCNMISVQLKKPPTSSLKITSLVKADSEWFTRYQVLCAFFGFNMKDIRPFHICMLISCLKFRGRQQMDKKLL